MRIFLTGSHGVGKSTLANNINLKGITVYDSFSKKFLKNKNEQKVGNNEFYRFQLKIFNYCSNIYVNEDNFISSRSFIDTLAYTNVNKHSPSPDRNTMMLMKIQEMTKEYIELLKEESDIFYFYIPIEFTLSAEGNELRLNDDINFQYQVDKDIKYFLDLNKIPYTKLTGTLSERIETVKKTIRYDEWLKKLETTI